MKLGTQVCARSFAGSQSPPSSLDAQGASSHDTPPDFKYLILVVATNASYVDLQKPVGHCLPRLWSIAVFRGENVNVVGGCFILLHP
jgi:hypothetical protein